MPLALRSALSLFVLALAAGCASLPVRVEPADPRQVHRAITASVLTTGRPSDRSLQVLERFSLRQSFREDPAGTLKKLHEGLAVQGDHRRLSALAELSFYHGERSREREYFFLAAVYSYALLFPGAEETRLDESDPRVRLAYDLYNRGLTEAMAIGIRSGSKLEGGRYDTPLGPIVIEVPPEEKIWAGHGLEGFAPAADYEVLGLRNRYRRPGVGAPLSAGLGPDVAEDAVPSERFLPGIRVPVTALVRIEEPRRALRAGQLEARIELYTPDEAMYVTIDGREVPLEFEASSSLASTLSDPSLWDFELKGFFSGTFRPLTKAVENAVVGQPPVKAQAADEGLLFVFPYRRGRIPLVLVHGTASSPGRWADLVNEVLNDHVMWDRFQVWLFLYNTGNPIGYSGGLLRGSLERAVAELDPEGRDPALRQMVVVGHSQGGLLAKLTAVDSGSRFWENLSDVPPEALDLDPAVRETLRTGLFFTPLPFVKRVIFVCTPHGGSYLASFSIARLLSDLISAPSDLTQVFTELVTRNQDQLVLRRIARLPTSLDNMTPGNPFIKALSELPVAPGIKAHSIIAVDGDGPPEGQSDGVVRYESAHVEGVESEFVVRSRHSAQGRPETIEEIRRILLEHAREARRAR